MRFKEPIKQSDFMGGVVSDVNKSIAQHNSVELAVNFDFDEILGSAVVRPGSSQIGSQLVDNKDILGLRQYVDPITPGNNLLLAAVNVADDATATIKNVATGADVVTGLTASTKVRFYNYGGSILAINGSDAPRAWNGTSWITTGGVFDLGDWPANESDLVIEFLDRIYANDKTVPYRVHYSTIYSSGAIIWDGDYVDIEPEDQGGKITAFSKVPGYVLFFKERSLHRWNYTSAFPESLVNIGTPSQESVVESGGLVFFYSNSSDDARGFYTTNGGRPHCISKDTPKNIRRFVDAITSANESKISGWATERVVAWSVGDITVDGETFNNVVLRYNRVLDQWSIRTYPTEFKVFASYLDSGVTYRAGGDDDGNVIKLDDGGVYKDVTTNIDYRLRTQSSKFGMNLLKEVSDEFFVEGKHLEGLEAKIIPDKDPRKIVSMSKLGIINNILARVSIDRKAIGTSLAIELWGTTDGNKPEIHEIELPTIDVKNTHEQ